MFSKGCGSAPVELRVLMIAAFVCAVGGCADVDHARAQAAPSSERGGDVSREVSNPRGTREPGTSVGSPGVVVTSSPAIIHMGSNQRICVTGGLETDSPEAARKFAGVTDWGLPARLRPAFERKGLLRIDDAVDPRRFTTGAWPHLCAPETGATTLLLDVRHSRRDDSYTITLRHRFGSHMNVVDHVSRSGVLAHGRSLAQRIPVEARSDTYLLGVAIGDDMSRVADRLIRRIHIVEGDAIWRLAS